MPDDKISIYAPVIIPTLNRHDHLKQCLESLMKCKGAEYTDVYVGVDLPPSDKYKEGYNKVKDYLQSIEKIHSFNKLYVLIREKNLGVGSKGNLQDLCELVFKTHDRVIVSEDDNIFSPGFLDFINKGLEKFKDDKSVFAICGYTHFYDIKKSGNTYFRQNVDFSAWGYGTWKDRREEYLKLGKEWYKKHFSLKTFLGLRKSGGNSRALQFLTNMLFDNEIYRYSDNAFSVFIGLTHKDVVMSTVSCVRNIGTDGSGVHFVSKREDLQNKHNNQELYPERDFEFKGDPLAFYEENNEIFRKSSYGKISTPKFIYRSVKVVLKSIYLKLFR